MSPSADLLPLPYRAHDLDGMLPGWQKTLVEAYRWMVLARTLDGRMLGLQRQGRVGFYGPATGQEAVSVGTALALTPGDWVFPGLREQLVALIRGHPLGHYMDHLFANDRDPARGRQMPCHPTCRDVRYASMSSVIGTQISQAVGVAYGLKLRHEEAVSVAYFGDGATSANDFHAGLNLAGVLQAPVLFCCTNNQWAISRYRSSARAGSRSLPRRPGRTASPVTGSMARTSWRSTSPPGSPWRGSAPVVGQRCWSSSSTA